MVQRARLAVILLIIWMGSACLAAQQNEGFFPPRLLTEQNITIPADWISDYTPPEVLFLVNVKPDSTATLVKVLDGKDKLIPYIENTLPQLRFSPARSDGESTDATLTLKLKLEANPDLNLTTAAARADSVKTADLQYIYQYINAMRRKADQNLCFSTQFDSLGQAHPGSAHPFYRTNLYLMGLNDGSLALKDGFIESRHLYYQALQYQILSAYRNAETQGNIHSFSSQPYLQPALLTQVEAGLGDYEYNFARVLIKKQQAFGLNQLYTEIGFLAQNGFWQNSIAGQTSSRIYFSYPWQQTCLEANYESFDQDMPSSQLIPAWQTTTPYTLNQRLDEFYLRWTTPWGKIAYRRQHEKLSNPAFQKTTVQSVQQLSYQIDLSAAWTDFDLRYQYNLVEDTLNIPVLYTTAVGKRHNLLLCMHKDFRQMDYRLHSLITDTGAEMLFAETGYHLGENRIGCESRYHGDSSSSYQSIFQTTSATLLPSAQVRWQNAVTYQTSFAGRAASLNLAAGIKTFAVNKQTNVDKVDGVSRMYSAGSFSLIWNYQDYRLDCVQTYEWLDKQDYLIIEQPTAQYQTRLKLSRELKYHNALSAGINLTGHSNYLMGDHTSFPISGSAVLDWWAGVKITDLFEFQLSMHNALDADLYGLYNAPRTLGASIQWFYLN